MCIGLVLGVLRRFSVRCRKGPPSGDTGPVTQVVTQIYARSGAPHSGRRRQTGAPRPRRRTRAAGKGALAPIGCAGHVRGAGARPPVYPLFTPCTKCHAAAMLFSGPGKFYGPGAYSFQWKKAVAASEAGPRRPVRSGWRGVEPRGGVGRSSGQHTRREKEPCAKPVVPGVFGQPSWVCAWWQSSTQCPRGPVYTALTKALHFWQGFSVHVEGGPNITH